MILCLDVGNTQIYGGVFKEDDLILSFRKKIPVGVSSDELGLFLKLVLRENDINPKEITKMGYCSVVPQINHSLRNAGLKYFNLRPFSIKAGIKSGLKIKYKNPLEVGADRIANAIGAMELFPEKNMIIVDLGTATTFCAVSKEAEYLGGAIIPGLHISMEALETRTAQLPTVQIIPKKQLLERSTIESIQSGLYFGHLAQLKCLAEQIQKEAFRSESAIIIATGGFASLYQNENVFVKLVPDLVLLGIKKAIKLNS